MGTCCARETGFELEDPYHPEEIEDMNQRIVSKAIILYYWYC